MQKGFPWPTKVPAYHATTALDAVLREGLKSRAELTGKLRHAAGGGPEESVSFTLDIRVARAICAGLRTLVLCAKREMSTAELLVAMDELAPKITLETRKEEKLDNDTVLHLDAGLYGVKAGMGWGPRYSIEMRGRDDIQRFEQMEQDGAIVDATYEHAGDAPRPYAAHGWAPLDVAAGLTEYRTLSELQSQPWCYDTYKRFLFLGSVADKVYDPFFFMTRMETLRDIDIEQIGIVEAHIDAEWVCGDRSDMRQLGYGMEGMLVSPDWSYACQQRLRDQASGREDLRDIARKAPSRDWASPDAWDTVYYTAAMAEVRVYDRNLITDLQSREDIYDVMKELEVDWFNQEGIEDVEDPIAAPYFRAEKYSLRQRGYLL